MSAVNVGTRRRARFHELEVSDVRPLTSESIEVTFAVPPELQGDYDYLPGQYVALRAHVDGREVRRSYSICRPPTPGTISVGIKRDRGGLFSVWAHENLAPGDHIDVMSPEGKFTTALPDLDHAHLAGIAAGSGVTPMMALASHVLASSPTARFSLVYTNRATQDVMFLEELADLKDRYPARLALHHVLSREQRAAPLLSGRIDAEKLNAILDGLLPQASVTEWFLCGPFELVTLCRATLEERGVGGDSIRFELFTTDADGPRVDRGRPVITREGDEMRRIEFTLDGLSSTVETPVAADEAILDAALRVRGDVPFACAGGVCGTCRARVVDGDVRMTQNFALEPDELERGYVLTCQSHPTAERVVVDYDV
ncbi:1,2-phenylacetyl-CoA epoxidase subunit PaaE [Microbacterium sp.]|uniref:1,2-phenylacetyl-CoA epoxidase subunit PaaE n=1 Tax=Microbacterium sp. TaxID=51671 RepID=UPI0026172DBA|nr:1,2-phenylacetyl-CoA epoxidase subunit PaaE [Microbacterium sp.]